MTATVVVPSRDRPTALTACLAALASQSVPGLEVVVVDDASVVPIEVPAGGLGSLRVVRGTGAGPAAARNLGVTVASGEVVLFTDDDCRPDPTWASALVARIAGGASVVAGPTVVASEAGSPARAAQVVTNHLLEASLDAGHVTFAPTSNLGARRDLLLGRPFDESFPLAAGEDRDWCDRVVGDGTRIAYVPDAVVRHHPSLDLRGFWRQQVRYGRGAHRFRSGGHRPRPPIGFYLDLLRKGAEQGPAVGGLVAAAQLATAVGVVREARTAR